MRGLVRRAGFAFLVAIAALPGTALAQTPPQDLPQVVSELRVESDFNGVNLVSGKTQFDLPVLSVPAAPNLRFDRVQNAAPYMRGEISGQAGEIPVGNWSVHTPTATESFVCNDQTDCSSVTGTGSDFRTGAQGNGGVFRQAGTGAAWHFGHSVTPGGQNRVVYATNVSYPDGENIGYTYDHAFYANSGQIFYRPTRIESNLGYFIAIAYAVPLGEPTEFYWGSPSEVTLYSTAAPTTPLGRLTYSYNAGTVTVTDMQNRTYSCTGCSNMLGMDLPVASGTSQQATEPTSREATQFSTFPMVGSVTTDGVQYVYNYTATNGGPPYLTSLQGGEYQWQKLTVTGPNGFNQLYNFTNAGQRNVLASMVDSLGRTTSYTFDIAYRPTQVIYPEGNRVSVTYDDFGNITSRTATPVTGSGLSAITQTINYPLTGCLPPPAIPHVGCYRPSYSLDGMNRRTDYVFNGAGQLTEQTEPADANGVQRRTIIDYTVSAAGISRATAMRVCGVTSTTTTCGTSQEIRTEYLYLGETRLVTRERRVAQGTGATLDTTYSYDGAGRLLATDGPLPGSDDTSYRRYDATGLLTGTISADPDGAGALPRLAVRNSYDAARRLIKVETGTLSAWQAETVAPANWTGFTVSQTAETQYYQNRKVREFVREGAAGTVRSVIEYSYDTSGRLTCTAARMNPAVFAFTGTPDACAHNTAGADGPDRITRNVYDAASQRLQLREGVGTTAEGTEATWAYNLNGQVTTVIDGNGNRAALRYDGHMRQDRWTFPSTTRPASFDDSTPALALQTAGSVNATDYEGYTYDAAGNRLTFRKRDGLTLGFQYDNLNRLILKTVPERPGLDPTHTRDVHYGYDLRDAQLFARFDNAGVNADGVTNEYDGFGRLSSSALRMDGVSRSVGSAWDAGSRRIRVTQPDGLAFTSTWDAAGRLTGLYQGTDLSVWLATFSYNPQGLPAARSERHGSNVAYAFDPLGRLTGLSDVLVGGPGANVARTFGYNPAGQIRTTTRDNDAYAWTGAATANRAYTTNGLNQYSNVAGTAFGYDANGNLTSEGARTFVYDVENRLVGATPAAGGTGTVALRYDPLGRLYEVAGPTETRRFVWDGDALVNEYNAAGTMTDRYVHGANPGADDPLVWYDGTYVNFLHADHQGSITGISTFYAPPRLNAYDEYGVPRAGNTGRFQYTGQLWLRDLGMYHYKARVYAPGIGRFMQTDPVGYEDQFNLYAYVGNDPVNGADPTGTQCVNVIGSRICAPPSRVIETRVTRIEGRRGTAEFGRNLGRVAQSEDVRLARESMRRVAESNYEREYGYTVHYDPRAGTVVSRLTEGPTGGNGVRLNLVDGNRILMSSGHAHYGLINVPSGAAWIGHVLLYGSVPNRPNVEDGPSRGAGGDLDSAARARRLFPQARFWLFQQRFDPDAGARPWEAIQY